MSMFVIGAISLNISLPPPLWPNKYGMLTLPQLIVLLLVYMSTWWSVLNEHGPATGYSPNPFKNQLLVKEEFLVTVIALFEFTNVSVISDGRNILGCPVGGTKCFIVK